jgi:hypothetical protein
MEDAPRPRSPCQGVHFGPRTQEVNVPLFSAGDRVSQAQYGDGTVMVADEFHTVIDFDVHGSRTFSTRLVQLDRTSTIAPPKPAKGRRRTTKASKAS